MKNIIKVLSFTGLALFIFISSCKHQFPEPNVSEKPPMVSVTCSADTVYFQQQVLPVFISNCSTAGCHDETSHESGVVLTSYSSIINTGEIKAGQPSDSKAWKLIVNNNPADRMPPPPYPALTQQQKDIIFKWIMQGAQNNSCMSASCDSSNVTYTNSIKPLILNYCQGCHNNLNASGGYDLSQYAGVKARVDDGKLWGSVNHFTGYSAMPKNGAKLSDCELHLIQKWITGGALNN